MNNLLERFVDLFEDTNCQGTPKTAEADREFQACLDRIFPSVPVSKGSSVGPCDELKRMISDDAFRLVDVYYRETAKQTMRFCAQLLAELLKEGDAA